MNIGKTIVSITFILLLIGCFIGGFYLNKKLNPCPIPETDTLFIYDTVYHNILYPIYIVNDTTIYDTVPLNVDTALILKNYFAKYVYSRSWSNDTIDIILKDTVTQNKFDGELLSYKIKTPFTSVVNEYNTYYNKYVSLGIDIPLNRLEMVEFEGLYTTNKYYFGIGYTPKYNSVSLKGGINIIKVK